MFETDDGITINTFKISEVIGRVITCDDGVRRKVIQITPSQRFPWQYLVNEVNQDEEKGGSWVHALSLSCQMHGKPLPSREQREAFERMSQAFSFQETDRQGHITLPSGIVIKPR